MSNFYGDLADEADDLNIMDDDLAELESDFIRSNSPLKKNISKSQASVLDENKFETKSTRNLNWLNDGNTNIPDTRKSTPTSTARKSTVRFFEDSFDMDILDNMGLDDTKPKTETIDKAKKENILSELFGKSATESKSRSRSFTDILNPPVSQAPPEKRHPVSAPKPDISVSSASAGRKRMERRGSNLLDPLGLFASPQRTPEPPPVDKRSLEDLSMDESIVRSTAKSKPADDLPDWLGTSGSTVSRKTTANVTKVLKTENIEKEQNKIEYESAPVQNSNPQRKETPPANKISTYNPHSQPDLPNKIDYQSQNDSIHQLHQQESQLLIALQLKKLEERLVGMEQQQKQTFFQQEKQLKVLLDDQGDRQRYVQEQISSQQERINEHIQMLMINPLSSAKSDVSEKPNANDFDTGFLEQAIDKVRIKYSDELQTMDNSYRKQIMLLEESLESIEGRLKMEITRTSQYYQSKMSQLEADMEALEIKHKQKVDVIHSEYRGEIDRITAHHQKMMDNLQQEHMLTIENIRKNKLVESNVVSENTSYVALLRESLEKLNKKSADIVEIESYLRQQFDLQMAHKEAQLKSKETELSLQLQHADKQKEILENDRAKLMLLVESLEVRLSEQTVAAKEAQWDAQNRESKLIAREAAMDRELAHIQQMAEREKQHIDMMRGDALVEHDRLSAKITEERLALAAEKARAETSGRLQSDFSTLKTRTEVEAAIQAAQEAATLANAEREKFADERRKLDLERKNLQSQERNFASREMELNNTLQLSERKKQEAEKMLSEAKLLEMKYNEQLKSLQTQLSSLRMREKKLAEDKVAMSKERISLHKGELCPHCATGVNAELRVDPGPPSLLRNANDADLTRLRFSEDIEK